MAEPPCPPLDVLDVLAAIHGLQTDVLADDPTSSEVFERLLATLLELTESEYGFIGERHTDPSGAPYLEIHAISDVARGHAAREEDDDVPSRLELRDLDSWFGVTVAGDGAVVRNDPAHDARSGLLPGGHPPLDCYLGLPIERGGELLGMVGLGNRPGGYDAGMIRDLAPFTATCAGVIMAWRAQEERRALEERVRLGERLASLGLLASRVAHDFNNILTGVKGRTHMARRRAGDLIDRELGAIEGAVDRMSELTRELLTFAGGREHRAEHLELGRLVEDVRVLLELALPRTTELAITRLGPAPVLGDPAPLRQVLMNFVTNATEAMGGEGRVEIQTGVSDSERWLRDAFVLGEPLPGACSVAVVRDHGPGIEVERLTRIFDPFVTSKPDGRGLGLAGVPNIVARHDGCVAVRNEPDGGATFAVLLPVAEGAPPQPEPLESVTPRGGTVFVFEADLAVRHVTCRVLAERGWQAEGCEDFEALLEAAGSGRLTAAVLDVSGPVPYGESVFWRLRERAPDLPVVLTTSFADMDVEAGLREQRAVEILAKPFGGAELTAALARLVSVS